jgi:addiction module HigA family antidote
MTSVQKAHAPRRAPALVHVPTPAEMIRELMSEVDGLTQNKLATVMHVSRVSINQLVNGRRAVTAEMAMRLAAALNTTPEFWLNLQQAADLEAARRRFALEVKRIRAVRDGTPSPGSLQEIE